MTRALLFDIETDGLLPELTTLHSLVIRDTDTGEGWSCTDHPYTSPNGWPVLPVADGLRMLEESNLPLTGHNVVRFDIPALRKLFPAFLAAEGRVLDTLILARVLWPEVKGGDMLRARKGLMPARLIGGQGLEAWGYRLGCRKGDFGKTSDWSLWSPEMQSYCEQDTEVNLALWRRIQAKNLDPRCVELEHRVAWLCERMTRNGFPFDVPAASALYAQVLNDKAALTEELRRAFPPIARKSVFVPKVNNAKLGYRKGMPVERVKIEEFNPGSREEIAERLTAKYGWKPTEYTVENRVQVDEDVLSALPYPEARLLEDYLLVDKRAGALGSRYGWLRLERGGRIHGEYQTAGAVTGRATHSRPNIAQVTKKCRKYGKVFRRLFGPPKGWVLVGADMSGLELRCLAHYLATFDDGAYALVVTQGDVHTVNQAAAGLLTRDQAKTFIYAFLYGAGAEKLGSIVDPAASLEDQTRLGNDLKKRFLKNTPGLDRLRKKVAQLVEERGFLVGLDGRPLTIRHKHAALNTLLQSAGAILCKAWIVAVEQRLLEAGLVQGWDGDFSFCAWVHDEIQVAARTPEIADLVARIATEEARCAGETFRFRCPTAGEAKRGANWAETH